MPIFLVQQVPEPTVHAVLRVGAHLANLKRVRSIVFEEPRNPDELERKCFLLAHKGGIFENQFHCRPQAWRIGKFRVNLVELLSSIVPEFRCSPTEEKEPANETQSPETPILRAAAAVLSNEQRKRPDLELNLSTMVLKLEYPARDQIPCVIFEAEGPIRGQRRENQNSLTYN